MMWYYYGNGGMPFGLLGLIFMGIFWILIIWFVVALISSLASGRHHYHGHHMMSHSMMGYNSALRILEERYAKGEINKAEFEEKKKDLMNK